MFRFLTRHRPQPRPVAAPPAEEWACAVLDPLPIPATPLAVELLAVRAHSNHLAHLSAREIRPAEFRLLARPILEQFQQAWLIQTGGRGTLAELLSDATGGIEPPNPNSADAAYAPLAESPAVPATDQRGLM